MSINWWADKQNVVYPYSRSCSHKKELGTDTCYKTQMCQENIMLSESVTKVTYCIIHSIYIKCPKQAKAQKQKTNSWFPRAGGIAEKTNWLLMDIGFLPGVMKKF